MNAALVAKILSRRVKVADGANTLDLLRYLTKKSEKKFIASFINNHEPKDLQYYLTIWRSIKMLNEPHRKAMQQVLGAEIDLQNILWAYRLKRFYGLYGDETYSYLIPIRHRLSKESLAKIVACKDVRSMQAELCNTIYKTVFDNFSTPEQKLAEAIKLQYRKESRCSHIALLCGYLRYMK